MTATIVLHLGPHKTATTLIQTAMMRARGDLPHHSIYVAETGRLRAGHHALAFSLWTPERRGNLVTQGESLPAWPDLVEEAHRLPDGSRLLVSSENFSHVKLDEISAARVVQGLDVELIVAIRDVGTLLPSIWQEGVKWGTQLAFDEAAPELLNEDRITLLPIVDRWQAATGARCVSVLVIGERGSGTMPVLEQFAAALGCPAEVLAIHAPSQTMNESMPWLKTESLRHVSITVDPNPTDTSQLIRQRALLPLLGLPVPDRRVADRPVIGAHLADQAAEVARRRLRGLEERHARFLDTAPAEPLALPSRGRSPRHADVRATLAAWRSQVAQDDRPALEATMRRLDDRPAPVRLAAGVARAAADALRTRRRP